MEKKIKFDNILAFIYKAMEKEYHISLCFRDITIGHEIKYTNAEGDEHVFDCFTFSWSFDEEDNLLICLDRHCVPHLSKDQDFYYYILNINNPKDIARWNILIEDVKEYVFNKIEYKFKNFFNPTNIDDLNDED